MDITALGKVFTDIEQEMLLSGKAYIVRFNESRSSAFPCMRTLHYELYNIADSEVAFSYDKQYNASKVSREREVLISDEIFVVAAMTYMIRHILESRRKENGDTV